MRFSELIDEQVKAEISGKNEIIGILVDEGLDVIVLYNGYKYIYSSSTFTQFGKI